jgi:threonine/homoserine/homoserine lactone efflux protein
VNRSVVPAFRALRLGGDASRVRRVVDAAFGSLLVLFGIRLATVER